MAWSMLPRQQNRLLTFGLMQKSLVRQHIILPYVFENNLVEKVYRSKDGKYDHVLLPTEKNNCFVVLVVDINSKTVLGYHLLDLNKLYS